MLPILCVIINYSVFAFFLLNAFQSRLRFGLKISTTMAILLAICSGLIISFFFSDGWQPKPGHLAGIIIWFGCALFIANLGIKKSFLQVFCILVMSVTLFNNIGLLSHILAKYFYPAYNGYEPYTYIHCILITLSLPFLWILLDKIFRQILEARIQSSFWKFAWIIPVLVYFLYFIKIFEDYASETSITSSDITFVFLWNTIVYLIFYTTLSIVLQMHKSIQTTEQTRLINRQIEMQKDLYEKLVTNFEKDAKLRHNFSQHLLSISTYITTNKTADLNIYLQQYCEQLLINTDEEVPVCSNHTINTILSHYMALAKKEHIFVQTSITIPHNAKFSDMDLCVIFGNLVENAFEACLRQQSAERFIRICANTKEQQLFIFIENSFNGEISEEQGRFFSAKRNDRGIGLSSVEEVASKNNGHVKIDFSNTIFKIYVYLSST